MDCAAFLKRGDEATRQRPRADSRLLRGVAGVCRVPVDGDVFFLALVHLGCGREWGATLPLEHHTWVARVGEGPVASVSPDQHYVPALVSDGSFRFVDVE